MMVLSIANIAVAMVVTLLNLSASHRRTKTALTRDSRALRIAIKAELRALVELCIENRKRLSEGANVLSLRASLFVYRNSMGRLTLFEEAEIAPLVTAYARTEKMEHFLAATLIASGSTHYRIPAAEAPVEEILDRLDRTRRAVQAAIVALGDDLQPSTKSRHLRFFANE